MDNVKLVDSITVQDVISWGPCFLYCHNGDTQYPDARLIRAGLGGRDSVPVMDVFGLKLCGADKVWLLVRPEVLTREEAIVLRQLLIRESIGRRYIGVGQCPPDLDVWAGQVVSPSGYAFDKTNPTVQAVQAVWDMWSAVDGNNHRSCILRAGSDSFRLALGCMGWLYGIHECSIVLDILRNIMRARLSRQHEEGGAL